MGKKQLLLGGLTLGVVGVMVLASQLTGQREILFPEVTAMAVGLFFAPKRSWQVSKPRMFWLITLCAWAGLACSLWMPGPFWWKLSAAFLFCRLVLSLSGTSFAPLISAGVLPVMLGTDSPVYPLAAMALTGLLILLQLALEQGRLKEKEAFTPLPLPGKQEWPGLLLQCGAGVGCILLAVSCGAPFAAAPPLLVAFTEFSRPGNPARKTPVRTGLLLFLSALGGTVFRYLLDVRLGLGLTLPALAATGVLLILLWGFRRYLPPAGALAVLAMLVPQEQLLWYPLEVLAGTAVYLALATAINYRELFSPKHKSL